MLMVGEVQNHGSNETAVTTTSLDVEDGTLNIASLLEPLNLVNWGFSTYRLAAGHSLKLPNHKILWDVFYCKIPHVDSNCDINQEGLFSVENAQQMVTVALFILEAGSSPVTLLIVLDNENTECCQRVFTRWRQNTMGFGVG